MRLAWCTDIATQEAITPSEVMVIIAETSTKYPNVT